MNNNNLVMGVCWYREDQWDRIKEIVVDPELFEDSYFQWRKDAEKALNEIRDQGYNPKKVLVDADALLNWSIEQGKKLDAATRSEYAVFLLKKRDEKYKHAE